MPAEIRNRFKALKVLSDRRNKKSDQFDLKSEQLSQKTEELSKPIFEQRQKIIMGETKDFEEQKTKFDSGMEALTKEYDEIVKVKKKSDDKEDKEDKEEKEEFKKIDVDYLKDKDGIPDFWFKAMKNNKMIFEAFKEKDE